MAIGGGRGRATDRHRVEAGSGAAIKIETRIDKGAGARAAMKTLIAIAKVGSGVGTRAGPREESGASQGHDEDSWGR